VSIGKRIVAPLGGQSFGPLLKKHFSEAVWRQQMGFNSEICETWTLRDVCGFSDRTIKTFGLPGATRPTPGQGGLLETLKLTHYVTLLYVFKVTYLSFERMPAGRRSRPRSAP
jgi:hypothetical protein